MSNREPLELSKLTKKEFPYIKKMSYEQEDMVTKLFKCQRVIVDAVAGSGKTTIATQAMNALKQKGHVDKIYYIVFPVQEGSLGFLPGDVAKKIEEYAVPFIQALVKAGVQQHELNDMEAICNPLLPGDYKVVPHTFLRGRNLERIGGIVDEIQNGTVDQIKKTLTRFEDDCYIAMIGHNGQTDIAKEDSGFSAYIHHFKRGLASGAFTDVQFAELTHNFRGDFSSFVDQIGTITNPEVRGPVQEYAEPLEK